MLDTLPFGRTGHDSTRVIFGAAALHSMKPERAKGVLQLLLDSGVNHIDVAERYGDAELRVGEWMGEHRDRFFLASKAGARDHAGVAASIDQSLARLQVEQLDLIQFHNLVDGPGFEAVFADGAGAVAGGGLKAALEARDAGKVRFIGVTGHGTYAPSMHVRSLERFAFDSVMLPYNFAMMESPQYRQDFETLEALCKERGVALQTIKSAARRRFQQAPARRFSWYEPLADRDALQRSVRWVLARAGTFLSTTSDARLLPIILEAASVGGEVPDATHMREDAVQHGIEPLFVRDQTDGV